MQDRIYNLIVEQNDVSWKTLLYDLIRSEEMNAWDIDISLLTQKYIERVNQLQSADLKLHGKVLLAAAMLLKIKSKRLVGDDLNEFDRLLSSGETQQEQFYDELEQELQAGEQKAMENIPELTPHFPLPRSRKVSVFDLVKALEKALEVKHRRVLRNMPAKQMHVPEMKFDITKAVQEILLRITSLFGAKGSLVFTDLLPSNERRDRIYTFLPLLQLANQRKIDLEQAEPFGEIKIALVSEKTDLQTT